MEPKEPETVNKPEVNVDGKVGNDSPPDKSVESDKAAQDKVDYEKAYHELHSFTSGLYGYIKETDDGKTAWDVERIVDELGYDVKSLKKKGENVTTPEPKGETPPENKSAIRDEFNKDPEAFLEKFTNQIIEKITPQIDKRTEDLRKEVNNRKAQDMIETVMAQHDDFEDYKLEIAKLAKARPPQNAEELNDLYFAAKGRKEAEKQNGSGLSGTNGGSRNPRRSAPVKSPEEEIADRIVNASGKDPSVSKAMMNLLGKSSLAPLRAPRDE